MASAWELAVPAIATLAGIGAGQLGQRSNTSRQWKHERRDKFLDERRQAYVKFITWLDTVSRLKSRYAALRKDVDSTMDIVDTHTRRRASLQEKIDSLASLGQELAQRIESGTPISVVEDRRAAILAEAETLRIEAETYNAQRSRHLEIAAELESRLVPINADLKIATAETFEWALTLEMIAPQPVREGLGKLIKAVGENDPESLSELRSVFMQAVRKDLIP